MKNSKAINEEEYGKKVKSMIRKERKSDKLKPLNDIAERGKQHALSIIKLARQRIRKKKKNYKLHEQEGTQQNKPQPVRG